MSVQEMCLIALNQKTFAVMQKGEQMDDNKKELIETMEGIAFSLTILFDYLKKLILILKDNSEVES